MKAQLAGFARFFRTLMKARDGGVAMIFAFSLPLLAMSALVGVDVHRIATVRANLQDALDAAALAAARSPHMTNAGVTDVGMAALRANLQAYRRIGLREDLTTFHLTPEGAVVASSRVEVDTLVANIFLPPYGRLMDDRVQVGVESEVLRSSSNLEVALVLDITGSMQGQRIIDLRAAASELVDLVVQDVQEPYYSKVAVIPYATAVNIGSLATTARGAPPASRAISDVSWSTGLPRVVTGATRANPVVITSVGHGFQNGDTVWITGVTGMTQLNNNAFTVAGRTNNTFQLQGVNGSRYSNYLAVGTVQKCQRSDCAMVVTSSNHGLQTNDRIHLSGILGLTTLNNKSFGVTRIDNNTLALQGANPGNTSHIQLYAGAGTLWCAWNGCRYNNFRDTGGTWRTQEISNCVTERTGSQAYTDASTTTAGVGRHYAGSGMEGCPSAQIMPLSSNRTALKNRINSLQTEGYTAGHIGLAWGWYAVSPNFNNLWTGESQPAPYGTPKLLKVVILMTDGEFNTTFAEGVLSRDSQYGTRINQNATNGNGFSQASSLCDAMKADGVIVYTVGFALGNSNNVRNLMNNCATDTAHVFLPESGQDLREAFRSIARSISDLRIAR